MFVTYRNVFSATLFAGLAPFSTFLFSNDIQVASIAHFLRNEATCNSLGECTLDVSHTAPNILQACESQKASIAWNRKKPSAFLVACDCECTSHDNVGWLIDAAPAPQNQKIKKLYLGKESTIEHLEKAPLKISDIVSSYPLCEKIDNQKLKSSIFVTLIKRATKKEAVPYCFSPAYIVEGAGGLEIRTNNSEDEYGELLRVIGDDASEAEIIKYMNGLLGSNKNGSRKNYSVP